MAGFQALARPTFNETGFTIISLLRKTNKADFCIYWRYKSFLNGTFHNDTLQNSMLQNGTALQISTVTKWYLVIKLYMLQNGMLQNSTVTKQYSAKRYTDIMVSFIQSQSTGFHNPWIGWALSLT